MSQDPAVQAVVFDLGNVLIGWDPEGFYDRVLGRERREALFAAVDLHQMNKAIDGGAPFRASIYDLAENHPDWRAEIVMWHDRWHELASPVLHDTIRLRDRLRQKGVPVFSLSNFGDQSFDAALDQMPFLAQFDRQFISGKLGVMKPDPQIYQIVEERSGIAPEALLFTDDNAENIAAAAQRGWQTHRFTGWQGFAARLVAAGLLTEDETQA